MIKKSFYFLLIGYFLSSNLVNLSKLSISSQDTMNIKLAILPFLEGAKIVQDGMGICHLTGKEFETGVIPEKSGNSINKIFSNLFIKQERYNLIETDAVKSMISGLPKELLDKYDLNFGIEVGRRLRADLILMGIVFRYEERVGSKWGVDKPASIAFSAVLIDIEKGEVVWKGAFNKTQRAFLDDLLEKDIPFKKRFTWLSVDQLAEIGVKRMTKELLKK